MTTQLGRPAGPQRLAARPAAGTPSRLSDRERAVVEDVAAFAVVASIAWHFVGTGAVLLGLVAVAASVVTRVTLGRVPTGARRRLTLGLGVVGVLIGVLAFPLGSAWLGVAGWALAASNLRRLVVR